MSERFPISDLVERTGVPPATIHHYLRAGLLPPPKRPAPNRFLYDARHIERLRLIRLLRDRRGLPLQTIRRILPELLGLEADQAFRPEMWERVLSAQRGRGRRPARVRILEAATGAFSRRGYAEVLVEDVCREAGVAKGSFYQHYRSKEELFLAAAESAAREVAGGFSAAIGGGSGRDEIVRTLSRALEPRLPIFLELVARALQHRPGYAGATGDLLRALAAEVGEVAGGPEEGRRALAASVAEIVGGLATPGRVASLIAGA